MAVVDFPFSSPLSHFAYQFERYFPFLSETLCLPWPKSGGRGNPQVDIPVLLQQVDRESRLANGVVTCQRRSAGEGQKPLAALRAFEPVLFSSIIRPFPFIRSAPGRYSAPSPGPSRSHHRPPSGPDSRQ